MQHHLDRHAFALTTFSEFARANRWLAYWQSHTVAERFAAVAFLSEQAFGPLAPDYDGFISQLAAHQVEFVVVGSHALAFHGVLTAGDLDILVRPIESNAERFLSAIKKLEFRDASLTAAQVLAPDTIVEMGLPPVQIHVMSRLVGVSWNEVWEGRQTSELGSNSVAFIGRNEFLRNKKAAGRLRDLADIQALLDSENPGG